MEVARGETFNIIGKSYVGKTCFVNRYMLDQFEGYIPTIGIDFVKRNIHIHPETQEICWRYPNESEVCKGGTHCSFSLLYWDLAGNEWYRIPMRSYYRFSQGIFMLYDITDRATFESLETELNLIEEFALNSQIVVIGTKVDLVMDWMEEEKHTENVESKAKRQVSYEEGFQFANKIGASFFEVSSKLDINIKEAFDSMSKKIYNFFIIP